MTKKSSVEKPLRLVQDTWKTEKEAEAEIPRWHEEEDAVSVLGVS